MIGDGAFWNWVVGGLAVSLKSALIYIWFNHEGKLTRTHSSHNELRDRIMQNYWTKAETQDYMDKTITPVLSSINNLADTNRELILELRKLNDKVIVLETVEKFNGRLSRGSP